jgi:hypothetical protein
MTSSRRQATATRKAVGFESCETRNSAGTSRATGLDLPPPFNLVMLRERDDAFAHAMAIAAQEGAATLVHVGRLDLAEFAVVLEPAERLSTARRAIYLGLCALGDALAAHAPPEKPISFDWPDAIFVDGGRIGGVRLGWPRGAEEAEPPPWLVVGGMVRIVARNGPEAGQRQLAAALEEEGFDDLGSGRLVESFARHLMAAVDAYQDKGFGDLTKRYLARLVPEKGVRRDIDENGDFLVRRAGARQGERRSLLSALATPSWLDPVTGGPRI